MRFADQVALITAAASGIGRATACFLASRDADFVTGVTIDVTGGI